MQTTSSLFFRLNTAAVALLFAVSFCGVFPGDAEARRVIGRTHTDVHFGGGGPRNPHMGNNVNIYKEVNVRGDRHPHNDPPHNDPPHNGPHPDDHYHHHHDDVGAALAIGAITELVVGAIVSAASMPPNCSSIVVNGVAYKQCGNTWYQPRYVGDQVNYIVVNPPR